MQKLRISILALFCLFVIESYTQDCYVPLDDITGIDRSKHQANFEALACSIADSLPVMYRDSFKIFDFGFYLHQQSMNSDYSEVLSQVRQIIAQEVPYYLLFAKESTDEGLYRKFLIDLKLPTIAGSPCFTNSKNESITALIEEEVNRVHKKNGRIPHKYYEAEEAGLVMLHRFVQQMTCCQEGFSLRGPSSRSNQCDLCFYTPEQQINLLKSKGMVEIAAEGLTIEVTKDAAYNNPNFETEHTIKINRAYGDKVVQWNFTDRLNNFLSAAQDASEKGRVLYFDDFACLQFEDYLEGIYPLNSNAPGLGGNAPFFEEIIILNIDGKDRVFFKFEGTDQSEASILWTLEHLAAMKRGGLYFSSIHLEVEECFADADSWLDTWINSKKYAINWDLFNSAWVAETGVVGAYGWSYPIAVEIGEYLVPSGPPQALEGRVTNSRSNKNIAVVHQIATENGIELTAGQDEDITNDIYKLYFKEPTSSGTDAYKTCKATSTLYFETTDSEDLFEQVGLATRTFFTPSGELIAIPLKASFVFNLCEEGKPDGTLSSFTPKGGKQYRAWKHTETGKFAGYAMVKKGLGEDSPNMPVFPFYDDGDLSINKDEVFIRVVNGEKSNLYTTTTTASRYERSEELDDSKDPKNILGTDFQPYTLPTYGELTECYGCEEKDAPETCKEICQLPEIRNFIASLESKEAKAFIFERCSDLKNATKRAYAFQIAKLIQNLEVHYALFKDNASHPDAYNWIGEWEEYKTYADALSDYGTGVTKLYSDLDEAIAAADYYKVHMLLFLFNDDLYYKNLSEFQRAGIIRVLALGPIGDNFFNNQESQILKLLNTIPEEDPTYIHDFLTQLKTPTSLLEDLLDKMGFSWSDGNREAFVTELTKLVNLQDESVQINSDIHLVWDLPDKDAYKGAFNYACTFDDGKIKFDIEQCLGQSLLRSPDFLTCTDWEAIDWGDAVDPYALISFVDIDKVRVLGNSTAYLGQWKKHERVPAIFAAYVIKQELSEQAFERTIAIVEGASLLAGAGELALAIKLASRWRMAVAGYTLVSDVASITLKKEKIKSFLEDSQGFAEAEADTLSSYIDNILLINAFLSGAASFIDLPAAAKAAAAVERGKELGVDFTKLKVDDVDKHIDGKKLEEYSRKAIEELSEQAEGAAALEKAREQLRNISKSVEVNQLLSKLDDYPKIQDWIRENTIPDEVITKIDGWVNNSKLDLLSGLNLDLSTDNFFSHLSKYPDQVNSWESLIKYLPDNLRRFAKDLNHLKLLLSPDVQKSLKWIDVFKKELFNDYPNLTPGEIIVLNHYTTEQGFQINFWLRELEVKGVQLWSDEFANTFLRFMDSAFEKLPNHNAPVFLRIEGGNSSEFALMRKGFTSFAKSNFTSFIHGARSNKTDIIESYIVKLTSSSKKIIDLEPFSQVPLEKEVLVYRGVNFNVNDIKFEQFPTPTSEEIVNNVPAGYISSEEAKKLYETQLNQWAGNTSNLNKLDFEYEYNPSLSLDEEHSFFEQKVKKLLGENAFDTDAYKNAILIKTIYVNGN